MWQCVDSSICQWAVSCLDCVCCLQIISTLPYKHIDKLLKSEKIVWNEFVFLSNQVEASYINYFEFSEKDYKGVEVNLSVLCDLPDSGYSKHTTITEISVSMTPDGEIRYIKPIYGPKTNISCN